MIHRGCRLTVSNFFRAFKSTRRLNLVKDVDGRIRTQTDDLIKFSGDDSLSTHPELSGFAVYVFDGHTHGASAHEKLIGAINGDSHEWHWTGQA